MGFHAKTWKILIGLAVSGGFLYLALRQVDFQELGRSLRYLRAIHFPGLILLVLVDGVARAIRWKLLLPQRAGITVWKLFRLETIGLAVNNVLPLRVGEFARIYLASREFGLPLLTVLAGPGAELPPRRNFLSMAWMVFTT